MTRPSIVSPNIRVRYPDDFRVGEGSIVDDYCYFSVRVSIGRFCHIANGVSIAGGPKRAFTLGDFSGLSAGVKIWCASDDFIRDLVTILPAEVAHLKEHAIEGDVTMAAYTGIGTNSVVMPDNAIPEGTVIGALSFVPARFRFEPWTVYAGNPLRRVSQRDRDSVLKQVEQIERELTR